MKDFFKHYLYPIATLSGSIIGVGFLSLPYITLQVGIWLMLFYFAVLAVVVVSIHVIFGRISLKTPDFKRWPGFIGFYFGKTAEKIIMVPVVIGSFVVMLVYLIIGSQFLSAIFIPLIGGSTLVYALAYFALVSTLIYIGIRLISKFEFWALALLLVALVTIFLKGFAKINLANLFMPATGAGGWRTIFLPYGAILFSLWGTGLIPEIEEMVRGRKKSLRNIIIAGSAIPVVMYLVFVFLVLGITGPSTTESALPGLKNFLGNGAILVALFIGVITTFTAFLSQGILLKKIFMYDLGIKQFPAWVFCCSVPLVLFLLGVRSFIPLVSFMGGILLGIDGILILLMYQKIGGKKIVLYPLMLVFILGIIYEIMYFTT